MGILDHLLKDSKHASWLNHRNLYVLGLATILIGLAWSQALMSVGQLILAGNWLLELNFKSKFQTLRNNKILWLLFSLYFLHLFAVLWSSDIAYALKDLRIKFPLFLLPLILGTTKSLNKKELEILFKIYLTTILVLSFASLYKLLGFSETIITDKRDLSIYISHIRYGLNIALACILSIYYRRILFPKNYLIPLIISVWLLLSLFLFELYTGLVTILPALFIILFSRIIKLQKRSTSAITLLGMIILISSTVFFISKVYKDYKKKLPLAYSQSFTMGVYTYSLNGEQYFHDADNDQQVNGVYVRRFIAPKELAKEWNKKSKIDYNGKDKKGNLLSTTLHRFMASKGLKKDSINFITLTDREIQAVENGVANSYYLSHSKIENRIHKIIYEIDQYQKTDIANGYSIAMRIEYWKTCWRIIQDNFWIGVGTGDIKNAFHDQYINDESLLVEKYRKRAHNQYLTFLATFGIIGLLLFIFYLTIPLYKFKGDLVIYLAFLIIASLSFITEDTLETQAGVTFFALFNTLFLIGIAKPLKTL